MKLIGKIKEIFKGFFKRPLTDPRLIEIAKIHAKFDRLIFEVDRQFGIKNPFNLQDDVYSSWVGHLVFPNTKITKFLPKMFGDKVSARKVVRGDVLVFATERFKEEGVYWEGVVDSIKPMNVIVIKRTKFWHEVK